MPRARGRRSGCWASGLEPLDALGRVLTARGFDWGWRPHWMAADLEDLAAGPEDPRVAVVEAVPEYDEYGQGLLALVRRRPARTWHAVARVDGALAGRAWAHVVGGWLGGAGLYDVDVLPAHRRQGLGAALTRAVARSALGAGARLATLNATRDGERLYAALGFSSVGYGQTWWIRRPRLQAVAVGATRR